MGETHLKMTTRARAFYLLKNPILSDFLNPILSDFLKSDPSSSLDTGGTFHNDNHPIILHQNDQMM